MPLEQKFQEWDAHICRLLEDIKHIPLDERWLTNWYGWAGHLGRKPPSKGWP